MKTQPLPTHFYHVFLIVFLIAYHPVFAQKNLEHNKVVTTVFKAFKKNNEKKILKCLPTKKDIEHLVPLIKEARPQETIPATDSVLPNFKVELIKNFRQLIKKGNSFGVEWENIVLTGVRYNVNPYRNVLVERGDITLECTSGAIEFLLIIKKSINIRGNWRIMNQMKFRLQ